jgi:glyoxylase-like metal-dependent hydrolase (beta-lactamase superfamily II)
MQLGDIQIDRILEMEAPFMAPAAMFPDATPDELAKHRHWMEPWALDPATGKIVIAIQTYVIRTPRHTILVDTCLGCNKTNPYFPEWHMRTDRAWYDTLRAKGLHPEQIDYVFCTHLHSDHCGWNTQLVDGRWVPTFPKATYIIAEKELQHVAAAGTPAYNESVLPCVEAGQVKAVAADFALDDCVWLEPTHGHTPGHVAVHLKSGQHRAVLCGDLIHSPLQCHYPQWRYWIDSDAQQAITTRTRFLQEQCAERRLMLTAHFPRSSFGYVEAEQDSFRFRFVEWGSRA